MICELIRDFKKQTLKEKMKDIALFTLGLLFIITGYLAMLVAYYR